MAATGIGGAENYHAQRYSVGLSESLAQRVESLCMLCVNSEPYGDALPFDFGPRSWLRNRRLAPVLKDRWAEWRTVRGIG